MELNKCYKSTNTKMKKKTNFLRVQVWIFIFYHLYELVEMQELGWWDSLRKYKAKKITPFNEWWECTQLEFVNVIMVSYYCNRGASGWKMQLCTPLQASIKWDSPFEMPCKLPICRQCILYFQLLCNCGSLDLGWLHMHCVITICIII